MSGGNLESVAVVLGYAVKVYISCLRTHKIYLQKLKFNNVTKRSYFSKGACSKPCTIQKCRTPDAPFKKILVANRGLTASRVFRACSEMDIQSVAIYSECDTKQPFRILADESYLVGRNKAPVDAYLDCNEIIKIAKRTCSDAIHPGIGFMAERSDFAEAVIGAGLHFIGPSPMVLNNMGNKVWARKAAMEAGIPVVPGMNNATKSLEEVESFALELGFPVILKAVFGGGGTGLCVANKIEDIRLAFDTVSTQALKTFDDDSLYVEKFLYKPRLIEVQLLADLECKVVHLLERDCSLQKQFKNCLTIAPAPCIDNTLRCNLIEAAITFAKHIGYQSVGSVEFLVDQEGKHYFIEISCQLKRDHCVTEAVTGMDIVQKQIRIAEGKTLEELCVQQECIKANGVGVHCAISTHDPENDYIADYGHVQKITYPEGIGVRVDGSGLNTGAFINTHYEPTIMRLTTKAPTLQESIARMKRAIKEVRIFGVKSNIPFLQYILASPEILEGNISTNLIDEKPLSDKKYLNVSHNRGQKILEYVAEVLVNGPVTIVPFLNDGLKPLNIKVTPPEIEENMCPDGLRQLLKEHGAYWFTDYIRERKNVMLCDTTMRNAQQSLLATRLRTYDMLQIAPYISQNLCDLYALENWGGETFHASLQHLYECPWRRIKELREAIPNIPFLMTIRGPNLVGYSNYPDNVVYEFCNTAVHCGIDMFRVCDPFNYLPNIELCIKAVKQAGGLVETAIMYTGDVSNPKKTKYNLDYYLCMAEQLVKAGTHVIAIKDIAGLLRPQAAELLVSKIRDKFCSIPIHVQTTDSSGTAVASSITAAVAGADIVDVAADPMSGIISQPNIGAIISAFQNTDLDTGFDLSKISKYNDYWQDVRQLYSPYDCTAFIKAANCGVRYHEIPGGQYGNLILKAVLSGLGDRIKDVQKAYHDANLILGDIVKDMPSSKAVGDLALYMVQKRLSRSDIEDKAGELKLPISVIHYLQGYMGQPDHGYPESFRCKVLKDLPYTDERPGDMLKPTDLLQLKKELIKKHEQVCDVDVISAALFPEYTNSYLSFRKKYNAVDKLSSRIFFIGPDMGEEFEVELAEGNVASIKLLGISGFTNECSERIVFFEMNGEPRFIYTTDKAEVKKRGRQKANLCVEGQIAAPKPGKVIEVNVKVGDMIHIGQNLALISSRKKESVVYSAVDGALTDVLVNKKSLVQEGDLMFIIDTTKKGKELISQKESSQITATQ